LGLAVKDLTQELARRFRLKETQGALVVGVEQGSAAADSGLRPGDLILEIDGKQVTNLKTYQAIIGQLKKGTSARFLIKRQGRTLYYTVEIPQ
jgi:S1-C subfamily serine protease